MRRTFIVITWCMNSPVCVPENRGGKNNEPSKLKFCLENFCAQTRPLQVIRWFDSQRKRKEAKRKEIYGIFLIIVIILFLPSPPCLCNNNSGKVRNQELDVLDRLLRGYDRRALPAAHLGMYYYYVCVCMSFFHCRQLLLLVESRIEFRLSSLLFYLYSPFLSFYPSGIPTVVHCEIFIRSFGSINPATMVRKEKRQIKVYSFPSLE